MCVVVVVVVSSALVSVVVVAVKVVVVVIVRFVVVVVVVVVVVFVGVVAVVVVVVVVVIVVVIVFCDRVCDSLFGDSWFVIVVGWFKQKILWMQMQCSIQTTHIFLLLQAVGLNMHQNTAR